MELIRSIISSSNTPVSAREISRRIMNNGESTVYHMLPADISAIIRLWLTGDVKSEKVRMDGITVLHYSQA